jgi:hypothetical protein
MRDSKESIGGTMILLCDCNHAFQDERYGRKLRVHNKTQGLQARCTVCGKERSRG